MSYTTKSCQLDPIGYSIVFTVSILLLILSMVARICMVKALRKPAWRGFES